MTGAVVVEVPVQEDKQKPPTYSQIVRDIALDLQHSLTRKGRAPFVLSGLPMFDDLWAIQQNLARCLAIRDEPHLRCWYDVLNQTLPQYQAPFAEVSRTLDWIDGIEKILNAPLPTDDDPGPGGDEVARRLAHYLGHLAELSDLSPWQAEFRQDLFDRSERYWSGLFHCYDFVGLPPTNNNHESLYGQTKRQLRRQLGVNQLREPLLRRGAWAVLQIEVDTPTELRERLAQVSWQDYAAEQARYERRQEQFCRLYRWHHHQDTVLEQGIVDWAKAIPDY